MNVRCAVFVALLGSGLAAQNSTRKIRSVPGPLAERIGEAVQWRADLDAALEESRKTGRPVFWYVPTVRGSRMDRKPEIDRYMMAGPFSWPSTIARLNQGFVPVRAVARGEFQAKYGLHNGEFIEPGYLILDGAGKELGRKDQITTWHPQWFESGLDRIVEAGDVKVAKPSPLWRDIAEGRFAKVVEGGADPKDPEQSFATGLALWRTAKNAAAVALWQDIGKRHPESSWAWKAAAEAEGHGPLVCGFEVHGDLPEAVLEGDARGSMAPAGVYDEDAAWQRSVAFLVAMQRENGGYHDSRYDFGGTDSLPNVYVAVSAVVGRALLAADRRDVSRDRVRPALDRLLRYSIDDGNLNRQDRDELLWAYIYRARFLAEWTRQRESEEVDVALQRAVTDLQAMQPKSGAWFHEYPNPFVIGSALSALHDAQTMGARIDQAVVDRGVLALLKCRTDTGAYSYGYSSRGRARARVEGAAGRMPRCELSLAEWNRSPEPEALGKAVARAFEHHDKLAAVRKYDDHADRLGYGGFFFWYDMLGRTEAVRALPEGGLREKLLDRQRDIIMELTEIDGAFVDSHELGRAYGTAMALWCLDLIAQR